MQTTQREWEKIRRGQQRSERRVLLGGSFLNVGLGARSSSRILSAKISPLGPVRELLD